MSFWRFSLAFFLGCAGFASAEDLLPLPKIGNKPLPLPVERNENPPLLKPSLSARPPVAGTVNRVDPKQMDARELALLEMERQLVREQSKKQVADEAKKGNANALKQLIVMLGPVNEALAKSPKPPVMFEDRIALIGLEQGKVAGKSLEQYFGSPLTPEMQTKILDSVKSQLAGKGKDDVEVSVAAWWPEEGVMAVSVVPKG
jgi:hypothetical protein